MSARNREGAISLTERNIAFFSQHTTAHLSDAAGMPEGRVCGGACQACGGAVLPGAG